MTLSLEPNTEIEEPKTKIELPKSFQPLQSLVSSTYDSEDEYDCFQQLCENVVPLLQTIPLLGSLRATWQEERTEHLAKFNSNEELAKRQVKKAHLFFVELLKGDKFQSIDGIKERLKKIEDLLENRDKYYTPPEYQIAYDELCDICSLLVTHGESDCLKEMVEITEIPEYIHEQGTYVLKSIPLVSHFYFAPAVNTVKELRSVWYWNKQLPIWVIWTHLCNAVWAWHTSPNIFAKEKLRHSSPVLRRRSMRLVELQSCLGEMQALKAKEPQDFRQRHYFKSARFKQFLRIIVSQIAVELAKNHFEIYDKNEVQVHAIELVLNGNELWIKIQWKEGQPKEQFCLKCCQYESLPHEFIKMLVKTIPNSNLTVPGRSPADLINRCNLGKGGLKELFFGKCTKAQVFFKGCRVEKQTIGGENLKELLKHLQSRHSASGSPICP